ncbi:MAG: hypothetical protein J3Q66DRAFT_338781 [Benniella sp.]|nr:MAG: hypothetical protein J3Q66DRAFT_338781 [Benniella sp.]
MSNPNQQPLHPNLSNNSHSDDAALPRPIEPSLLDEDHPYPAQLYQSSQLYEYHHASTSTRATALPEDAPPSYEAAVHKDIAQIHDNYDHLRGPPGHRGQDIKIRIPAESLSSSPYHQMGGGSSSSAAGPSTPRVPASSSSHDTSYGAIRSGPGNIVHSPTSAQAPPLGLRGQIALSPEDEETELAQDVDRLLGAESNSVTTDLHSDDDSSIDQDTSSWAIVGDGQVWWALFYLIVLLMPWTLFCFVWTFCMALASMLLMIIPPLGYLWAVLSITSWRALARVDVVLARSMVSEEIQQRYPYIPAKIWVRPEPIAPEPAANITWRILGFEITLPSRFFAHRRRSASRRRRVKNIWQRSAKHMRALLDRHTVKSMFYFTLWKMMFALPIWCVILLFFGLTIPFMICFLPSLLVVSRAFANWQYRWSVKWLGDRPAPIVI